MECIPIPGDGALLRKAGRWPTSNPPGRLQVGHWNTEASQGKPPQTSASAQQPETARCWQRNEIGTRVRGAWSIRSYNDRSACRKGRGGGQFVITALGTIAAVTLMLATAPGMQLIPFTLASHTREIGIRTALGAALLRIVRGILSPVFMKVGIGIVLGSISGTALIYATPDGGIKFRMTVATACVDLFIIAVAMISCIWPVRRALKIQPITTLRAS